MGATVEERRVHYEVNLSLILNTSTYRGFVPGIIWVQVIWGGVIIIIIISSTAVHALLSVRMIPTTYVVCPRKRGYDQVEKEVDVS